MLPSCWMKVFVLIGVINKWFLLVINQRFVSSIGNIHTGRSAFSSIMNWSCLAYFELKKYIWKKSYTYIPQVRQLFCADTNSNFVFVGLVYECIIFQEGRNLKVIWKTNMIHPQSHKLNAAPPFFLFFVSSIFSSTWSTGNLSRSKYI